jgi:DNA-binding NarL/FixJ family response regulator
VLQLIAEGRTIKEIAALLNISPKTVEFHKAQIIFHLNLRTTAELTKYALAHGLTSA